ncbi:hypothetical protein KY338_03375 [Candidatus Woesearchaeota archaeon]|nr:hypothetical protein [Candidatus Woesearchaeota archaeon]MBW3005356.1 hypothetical protein [Candidatus Woesearchaeota archaeon]
MRVKKEELKVKPKTQLSEKFLDLRTMDNNVIIQGLEENIRLREMPIEKHIKKNLKRL